MKKQKIEQNIKINLAHILKVQPAASKEPIRQYLNSVYIEDFEGKRFYTSVNGHILLSISEEIEGGQLEKPISIYPIEQKIYKNTLAKFELEKINEKFYILKNSDMVVSLKVNPGVFPDWRKVLPSSYTEKAKEYCAFNPIYLRMLQVFFKEKQFTDIPIMQDNRSAAMFKRGNHTAVLMPLRVS